MHACPQLGGRGATICTGREGSRTECPMAKEVRCWCTTAGLLLPVRCSTAYPRMAHPHPPIHPQHLCAKRGIFEALHNQRTIYIRLSCAGIKAGVLYHFDPELSSQQVFSRFFGTANPYEALNGQWLYHSFRRTLRLMDDWAPSGLALLLRWEDQWGIPQGRGMIGPICLCVESAV